MYCKNCGARLSSEHDVCPMCGYSAANEQGGFNSYQSPENNYDYNRYGTNFSDRQAYYEQSNSASSYNNGNRQNNIIKIACACLALAVAVSCSLPFLINKTSAKEKGEPIRETVTQQSSDNSIVPKVPERAEVSNKSVSQQPAKIENNVFVVSPDSDAPKTSAKSTTKAATKQADTIPSKDKSYIEPIYSNGQVSGALIRLWGTYKELSISNSVSAYFYGSQHYDDCKYEKYFSYEFDLKNHSANVNVSEYYYENPGPYDYESVECLMDDEYYRSSYCSYSISHDYVDIYVSFDRMDDSYDWNGNVCVTEGAFRTQTGATNDWLGADF